MDTRNSELIEYRNDPRIPCRYGIKCYQKNSTHHTKYKHPPKNNKRQCDVKDEPSKKVKLDKDIEEQENSNTVESQTNENVEELSNKQTEEVTKKECISDSASNSEESESEVENRAVEISTIEIVKPRIFIKENFLVDMPPDFYDFWEFCKELKPSNPCDALTHVGLKLVGAYDVLAGYFNNVKKLPEDFLRHWRYYYDPPELQTVLKGDNTTGYHIGYFFDSPDELPAFLISNNGVKDGNFTKIGDNIFGAVHCYLEELKKTCDPFKKLHIEKLLTSIKNRVNKLELNISKYSEKMKKRDNKVVVKTSNKVGLIVPYNKKTQMGFRDLAMSDKELKIVLNKLERALPDQKAKFLSDLQPVLTYANIALDECDFGTGVKLGWELIHHGIDMLDTTILQFLSNSYKLLKKDAFVKIAEAHFSKRKKGCELSVL